MKSKLAYAVSSAQLEQRLRDRDVRRGAEGRNSGKLGGRENRSRSLLPHNKGFTIRDGALRDLSTSATSSTPACRNVLYQLESSDYAARSKNLAITYARESGGDGRVGGQSLSRALKPASLSQARYSPIVYTPPSGVATKHIQTEHQREARGPVRFSFGYEFRD